jgi:rhodanese-related sulfurtransferase
MMAANLIPLKPSEVADLLKRDDAVVVDVREAGEFARRHIKGSRSCPLSVFAQSGPPVEDGRKVVFTCKSGMRTTANRARLQAAVEGEAFVLEGGIDAWARAGLPLEEDRKRIFGLF